MTMKGEDFYKIFDGDDGLANSGGEDSVGGDGYDDDRGEINKVMAVLMAIIIVTD